MKEMNKREECLRKACECVNQSRKDQYGNLEDNFERIATLWSGYLFADRDDIYLSAIDVANMMILLKVGRSYENQSYEDNYIDMAGYAACAYELASGESVVGADCASCPVLDINCNEQCRDVK